MTPADQQFLASPQRRDGHGDDGTPGDCFRACVASLLDLPIEDVPHFVQHVSWWNETRRFVRATVPGWDIGYFWPEDFPHVETVAHGIGSGVSPRMGAFKHAVIVDTERWEVEHDPHPSRLGIVGDLDGAFLLVRAYDPPPPDYLMIGAS